MKRHSLVGVVMLAVVAATATGLAFGEAGGVDRSRHAFWPIDPDDFKTPGEPTFPETSLLAAERSNADIGVAFSGGGVRSASATTGELRGLAKAKLLDRVKYVSAVSGGAWAVIPWTFSGSPNLLGDYIAPGDLQFEAEANRSNGSLADAIKGVSLTLTSSAIATLEVWTAQVAPDAQDLEKAVRGVLKLPAKSTDTYRTLLARNLLAPLLPGVEDAEFSRNEQLDHEFDALNPGHHARNVKYPLPDRPFMIVNANVVIAGADLAYPTAVPIEFTPMYVGSRQQVGGRLGGMYAWPSAYNPATARNVDVPGMNHVVEVTHDDAHKTLTLADLAASTGAAPLFWITGGSARGGLAPDLVDLLRTKGGAYFPAFTHLGYRDGQVLKPLVAWPHADGGARDNLGIAALLARHVKNIIAFVNVDSPDFVNNGDIGSLFEPTDATSSADKRGNVVFSNPVENGRTKHQTIAYEFALKREAGRPLVWCDTYDVIGNRLFNVKPYTGVHVCWVYPDRVADWTRGITDDRLKALLDDRCTTCGNDNGRFANFPWYDTFAQNHDPKQLSMFGLLKLSRAQVNLLGHLMAWTVVESSSEFEQKLPRTTK